MPADQYQARTLPQVVADAAARYGERIAITDGEVRLKPHSLFGLQTWVALSKDKEEDPAAFEHAP